MSEINKVLELLTRERIETERLAKIERKSARAPDVEKMKAYANLVASVPVPCFSDESLFDAVHNTLDTFVESIGDLVAAMESDETEE